MPAFIVIVFLLLITSLGLLESNKSDPIDAGNIPNYNALMVAENAFYYTTLLYQYGQTESSVTNIEVNLNDLTNYSGVSSVPLLDYQLVLVNYESSQFLVNAWSNTIKPGTAVNDVLGNLSELVNKRIYQSNDTFWELPMVGTNNGCNFTPYSFIESVDMSNVISVFQNICNQVQTNLGITIKPYVIFEQVVAQ